MSEFVCFELDDDNDINLDDERVSEAEMVNDTEFNDDTEFNKGVEKYYAFANVSREYDMRLETLAGFDFSQELNNYCSDDDACAEVINEFKDLKKHQQIFKEMAMLILFSKQFCMQSGTLQLKSWVLVRTMAM